MRKILIVALAAFLAACSPGLRLQSSQTTATDTVILTERVRDTVVVVEPDRSMIRALLECDSLGKVQMRRLLDFEAGARLQPPELEVKDNVLTATAEIDSMSIYLELRDRLERRITTSRQVEVVEVNRLNTWQRAWMRFGQFAALLLAGYGALKLRKLLKR